MKEGDNLQHEAPTQSPTNPFASMEAQLLDVQAPAITKSSSEPHQSANLQPISQATRGLKPEDLQVSDATAAMSKEPQATLAVGEISAEQQRSASLSKEVSVADLQIGPSNARKRDVPSTSWSDEPNQAFRQKMTIEPQDERDEGESKLSPPAFPDINEIKLTQMQLTDRQGSHARAGPTPQLVAKSFSHSLPLTSRHQIRQTFLKPEAAQDPPLLPGPVGKRAANPLSVSEPSDSPLKRRLMRASGSDSDLKSMTHHKRHFAAHARVAAGEAGSEALQNGHETFQAQQAMEGSDIESFVGQDLDALSDSSEASHCSKASQDLEGALGDDVRIETRSLTRPAHSDSVELSTGHMNGVHTPLQRLNDETEKQLAHVKLLIIRDKSKDAFKLLQDIALKYPGSPDVLCQLGICYGLAQNRAQAVGCFTTALKIDEDHLDSLLAFGSLYRCCDLLTDAVLLLKRAYQIAPNHPEVQAQLVAVLGQQATKARGAGRPGEALKLYKQAKAVSKAQPAILYNIAALYSERGEFDKALRYYQKAVEANPHYAEAHCNIGVIYKNRGQTERAIDSYRAALQASPNFQIVRSNMALALTEVATSLKTAGEFDKCIAMYEEALVYDPKCAEALYNLAVAYGEHKQIHKSIFMYEMCLLVRPNCAEAHNNLGVLHRGLGNLEKAYHCYMAALQHNPKFHQALSNVAVVYTTQGKAHEAHQLFVAAIAACPTYAEAYNNLGVLQRDVGQVQCAIDSYEKCLMLDPSSINASQNRLLALNYIHHGEDAKVCSEHKAWGLFMQKQHPRLPRVRLKDRKAGKKLTVGYVSPDFFTHSVSYFAEAPLSHHTDRIALKVYNCTMHRDAKTERLKAAVERKGGEWIEATSMDTESLAQRIRADEVDILVDLTGHTANNRLAVMAMKPAPVQVTWIGYPNSTGLEAVDYRFTDEISDPSDTTQTYVEELIRLPQCFLCYTPSIDAPEVSSLPCQQVGFITFGSFNALSKITGEVVKCWAKILERVPQSRLVLKNKPFACPHAQQYFQQQFVEEGVDSSRIDLLPLTAGNKDHLATYSMMDISLDPWPYAGTTTTCESLFMGVPCVSLKGKCHAHNVGATLLACIGMEDWLANSQEEYIDLAVSAAQDVDRLADVRADLRQRVLSSYLCDAPGFISNLEDQYEDLWARWKASKS